MTNGLQSLQTGFHCLHHALALPAAFGSVPGAALEALVKRAIQSGDIRKDIEPFDLLRALIGLAKRGFESRLAAKRQEAGGYLHCRFAAEPCQTVIAHRPIVISPARFSSQKTG